MIIMMTPSNVAAVPAVGSLALAIIDWMAAALWATAGPESAWRGR